MDKNLSLIFVSLFLISCTPYSYEVCDSQDKCTRVQITNIVQPSLETTQICNQEKCENVPVNRLLFKGGTTKTACNGFSYPFIIFVDNWWNSEGLIDNCEMPPNSNMQFIFKQHDQSIRSHTGSIQIKIDVINPNNNYLVLQIYTGEDNDNNNLPDSWIHCGNIDEINGRATKYIFCNGTSLKFIKIVHASWSYIPLNELDLNKFPKMYIDNVEILRKWVT